MTTGSYFPTEGESVNCNDEGHAHGCPCRVGGDVVRLSYLRCSECGDFLDETGSCAMHGQLDPEPNVEGWPEFNGAFR